jgi:ATP-binding cassette, subfamily F, member 3
MSLLTAANLSKFFGATEIFSGISVEIPHSARIALVGPNGAGKTTLVQILLGQDSATSGTVQLARGARMAYLPQRVEKVGEHTLWEEALRAYSELRQMEARLAQLETAMTDPKHHDRALAEYGPLQADFDQRGGYIYENRMRFVLHGLGFGPEDYATPMPQLSGGQKTRALLARLLLQEPDLLLLDEPTNHLDIHAVGWLEAFLTTYEGAVLAISHDRAFIDAFARTVWELEFGRLTSYRGNYSHYMTQRDANRERLARTYEQQQEFITKEMAFIRKHMGSRLTAQAKGRLKKLNTMEKRGRIISGGPRDRHQMALQMQAGGRSGDLVLRTRDLAVGYPDDGEVVLRVPDITLLRGEVAALVGPNGAGKSTFLKTVFGQLTPLAGEVRLGARVHVGYFAQAHERLNEDNTLLEEILALKSMPISEARNLLGRYLFSGDDVHRSVASLSGGERGRLALAKLALSGANLLLLDEPTNHLDIDSQEVLQAVLADYKGTILLVSHDRYLIDQLATQIWSAEGGALDVFAGTWSEYLAARAGREARTPAEPPRGGDDKDRTAVQQRMAARAHGLNEYQLRERVAALEARISALEADLDACTTAIGEASRAGDAQVVAELGARYTRLQGELVDAMAEWEELAE